MGRKRKATPTDQACEACLLPDCYPKNAGCLKRDEQREKQRKIHRFAPVAYTDRHDYMRQYQRRSRPVALKGVRLPRIDMELLEKACRQQGRTLAEVVKETLETMVKNAREQQTYKGVI